jgi:hypothetical protein
MRSERNANRATPCQAFPGTRFGSETTPATDGTSLKGTTVRRMGYNPATQGLRRVIARAGIRETSGIALNKNAKSPRRQDVPRAPQPNCALGKNRMSDSRRFQTSVYAALPLMVRPACKSAARFANMPARSVPKEPEHAPLEDSARAPSNLAARIFPENDFSGRAL